MSNATRPLGRDGERRNANAIRGGSEAAGIRADSRSVYPHPATIQGLTNYGNIPSCHTYQTPEQRKYPIREKRANEKTNTTTGHPK